MTSEKRREYMKAWRQANKERIKEADLERLRRKALADLESVSQLEEKVFIIKAQNDQEYIIGDRAR